MNVKQYIDQSSSVEIIQRNTELRRVVIEGSYFDSETNSYISLLDNGELVNRPLRKDEKAYKFVFSQRPLFFNTNNPMERDKLEVLVKHPHCYVPGEWGKNANTNCKNDGIVYVVNRTREAKYDAMETKILLAVANRVNSMSLNEMHNACYLIGYSPIGKTEDEIFQALYDYSQGNPDAFTEITDDVNMEKNIILKKALSLGVLKNERNNYYWGQEIIGQDESDILGYFVTNPEQYKGIRNQVAKRDRLPVSANKVSKPKAVKTKADKVKV